MRAKNRTRIMRRSRGATSPNTSERTASRSAPPLRFIHGLGWNGRLRDVFSWAALEALCVAWGIVLLGAYIAFVEHTFLSTRQDTLSAETATRALLCCTPIFIAHGFMLRDAVRVLQSLGHEVCAAQIMVRAPDVERHAPTTHNATKYTGMDVKSNNGKHSFPSSVVAELVLGEEEVEKINKYIATSG